MNSVNLFGESQSAFVNTKPRQSAFGAYIEEDLSEMCFPQERTPQAIPLN